MFDAEGKHELSCEGGLWRPAGHRGFNDLIWRALSETNSPENKEQSGLLQKRPDDLTLIKWQNGIYLGRHPH